jgi:hypothetical protein
MQGLQEKPPGIHNGRINRQNTLFDPTVLAVEQQLSPFICVRSAVLLGQTERIGTMSFRSWDTSIESIIHRLVIFMEQFQLQFSEPGVLLVSHLRNLTGILS